MALSCLTAQRYSPSGAAARRETATYIQAILPHSRAAGMKDSFSQLTFAWNGIGAALRRDIPALGPTTTIADFGRQLEDRKDTWFELCAHENIDIRPQPSHG